MNFVEQILAAGFVIDKEDIPKATIYGFKTGWNGLTVQHPYIAFKKNDYKVTLSLDAQTEYKVSMVSSSIETTEKPSKKIRIYQKEALIYSNDYGVVPPEEIINVICQ